MKRDISPQIGYNQTLKYQYKYDLHEDNFPDEESTYHYLEEEKAQV